VLSVVPGCFLFGSTKKVTVVPLGEDRKPIAKARVVVDGKPIGQGTTSVIVEKAVSVTIEPGAGSLRDRYRRLCAIGA